MKLETAKAAFDTLAGGTFVGMDTETVVALTGGKKNPQQGRVTKVMTGATVMCFSNTNGSAYDAMVKRRLAAEGKDPASFELGPRAWGERIAGTPFVQHKGAHYLEVIFMRAGEVQYMLDGKPVDEAAIEGLPQKRDSTGQGGLENQVAIRTFGLDSIIALRANGKEWH
jgi:hypothetical protein